MSRGPRKSKEVREAEARDYKLYAMKRSEVEPKHPVFCTICGERKSWGQFELGDPPVCCDCAAIKHGRATPAEPGTAAVGQPAQLAPSENHLAAPDIGLNGAGHNGRNAQLALFES